MILNIHCFISISNRVDVTIGQVQGIDHIVWAANIKQGLWGGSTNLVMKDTSKRHTQLTAEGSV